MRGRRRATGFWIGLWLAAASVTGAQEDAGFVPLFNGRDLAGWVNVNCAPDTWSVREGMIYSTGKPICELRTGRMYENFVLELEYKHVEAGGNAGVFIWGDALTARGQPFVRAIEVQVLDGRNTANYTSHGDVFPIHGARMTPDRPHPNGSMRSLPSEHRARPAGEWNHYRITAQNGTLKLAVNGKEVSGGYDISPRRGYIHLESEGGVVWYRHLRLKELPPGPALTPDQIAREDEGFVSLYTGTGFSGWRLAAGQQGHWVSKDWIIAYDGKAEGPDRDLSTEHAYGDVSVIVDWRVPSGAAPDGLPVRVGGDDLPASAREAIARALAVKSDKPQWHRAVVIRRGGRLSIDIDGERVVADVVVPDGSAAAPITLRHTGHPTEFANVFAKGVPVPPRK